MEEVEKSKRKKKKERRRKKKVHSREEVRLCYLIYEHSPYINYDSRNWPRSTCWSSYEYIHVCCARPRSRCNNLPAGWYVIECKAQQKYAWVHPLGFTMGATTLNLFTHLLIRSCTPLMLTQPCRRNNSYDIYLLNPFFPIIHYI